MVDVLHPALPGHTEGWFSLHASYSMAVLVDHDQEITQAVPRSDIKQLDNALTDALTTL